MTFLSPLIHIFLFTISVTMTHQLCLLYAHNTAHILYAHNTAHVLYAHNTAHVLYAHNTAHILYAHNTAHILITYLLFPLYKKSTDKIFGIL